MSSMLDPIVAATRAVVGAIDDFIAHAAHDEDHDAIEIDDDGWMHGDGVELVPLVDKMQALATLDGDVDGVVWHYTDTRNAGAVALAKRIQKRGGKSRSCHAWIDARGAIAQSAPFRKGTWHAGSTTALLFAYDATSKLWKPASARQRGRGANSWAAGIELENVGEVKLVDGQWLGWPHRHDYVKDGVHYKPAIVPADEVAPTEARPDRGWHKFTLDQIKSATRVQSALTRRYGLLRPNCEWGHSQIDPTRRTDPGPLWIVNHLPAILDRVYGAHA